MARRATKRWQLRGFTVEVWLSEGKKGCYTILFKQVH